MNRDDLPKPVFVTTEEGGEWIPFEEWGPFEEWRRVEDFWAYRRRLRAEGRFVGAVHTIWFDNGWKFDCMMGWRDQELPVPTHEEMLARRSLRAERPRVRVFTDVREAAQ